MIGYPSIKHDLYEVWMKLVIYRVWVSVKFCMAWLKESYSTCLILIIYKLLQEMSCRSQKYYVLKGHEDFLAEKEP